MLIKKSNLLMFISALLIIIAGLIILIDHTEKSQFLSGSCTSVMEVRDTEANFSALVNVTMMMNPDGNGVIDISGSVFHENEKFILSREIKFTYAQKNADIYEITNLSLKKHAPDRVNDTLMENSFFSIENEGGRYMTLTKMRNAYIIGTLQSPAFICVDKL